MPSAWKEVANIMRSGVVDVHNSKKGYSLFPFEGLVCASHFSGASRARRTVMLQQSAADTVSIIGAPDEETKDSVDEVQESHKRHHQRTRSPDVQLARQGEPANSPSENTWRWESGQDRQRGNTIAFGSSGVTIRLRRSIRGPLSF